MAQQGPISAIESGQLEIFAQSGWGQCGVERASPHLNFLLLAISCFTLRCAVPPLPPSLPLRRQSPDRVPARVPAHPTLGLRSGVILSLHREYFGIIYGRYRV